MRKINTFLLLSLTNLALGHYVRVPNSNINNNIAGNNVEPMDKDNNDPANNDEPIEIDYEQKKQAKNDIDHEEEYDLQSIEGEMDDDEITEDFENEEEYAEYEDSEEIKEKRVKKSIRFPQNNCLPGRHSRKFGDIHFCF